MLDRRHFLKSISFSAASLAVGGAAAASRAEQLSRGKRPNIILIVSDQHSATACGCYGSPVRQTDGRSPTPAIDALAANGLRFDSMYCASPLCAPSRAAYMTGLYPHSTAAIHHKMQRRGPGLSRLPGVAEGIPGMGSYFRQAGYRTAAIGKMHVHGETADGWDMGFDERDLRFYTQMPGKHYADLKNGDVNNRYRESPPYLKMAYRDIDPQRFAHAPQGLLVKDNGVNQHYLETLVEHEDEMLDALVTTRSLEFINRQAARQQPFFIHVGLEKPHRPWTIHQKFLDRFDPSSMPLPHTVAEWTSKGQFPFCQSWCHSAFEGDAARRSIAAYYACASSMDDCVGRIMEGCRKLDILDNTLVIYTSDHGESLYQHGLIEKHNMLDPAARVPFIISAPWLKSAGSVCNEPASLIDLIPTMCELSGVAAPARLEGFSLMPALAGKADPERLVFSEFYQDGSMTRPDQFLPVRMGLNRQFKYIYTHAAADQLYLRDQDDEERLHNRAFDPAYEPVLSKLRLCTLDRWELDEFPQICASAAVNDQGLTLEWEDPGASAHFSVYRSNHPDPRQAERIASSLTSRIFHDTTAKQGAVYHYWILGHPQLDRPFVDGHRKSRYARQPILSDAFPFFLPISPPIEVKVAPGFFKVFAYKPLAGLSFNRHDWIRIGSAPQSHTDEIALSGPVTILSSRAPTSAYSFSAEVRTGRPGFQADHVLMLLANYHNMHLHYAIGLHKDGTLGIWKRSGEWNQEALALKRFPQLRIGDWHHLEVRLTPKTIAVLLDRKPALSVQDPNPIPPARFGFDAPLHLASAHLRGFGSSIEKNPWIWHAQEGTWRIESSTESSSPANWIFQPHES